MGGLVAVVLLWVLGLGFLAWLVVIVDEALSNWSDK